MNAMFTDIHGAADFIGPGAIEVPLYQTEITDLVQRRGIFGRRIKQVPATGHPSRYFEETAIPSPSATILNWNNDVILIKSQFLISTRC